MHCRISGCYFGYTGSLSLFILASVLSGLLSEVYPSEAGSEANIIVAGTYLGRHPQELSLQGEKFTKDMASLAMDVRKELPHQGEKFTKEMASMSEKFTKDMNILDKKRYDLAFWDTRVTRPGRYSHVQTFLVRSQYWHRGLFGCTSLMIVSRAILVAASV